MNKFQVGDRVVCVKINEAAPKPSPVVVGETYIVDRNSDTIVHVEGVQSWMYGWCFQNLEERS